MSVQDRYEILGSLGEGGMARVYRARDRVLSREVAVKIPRPEVLADAASHERFFREARSAASLTHNNIVRIYDFAAYDFGEGERPCLVMELVCGEDLRAMIDRLGALGVGEALGYARQVLTALQYAHDHGVVHRDLSARNVLIDAETGAAKVSDFGIARALGESTLTPNGHMVGSVGYMSPEMARGDEVGPASDLYSVGCLLYELVTGRLPFSGDNPVQTALKHVQEEPVSPDRWREDLPSSLVSIILRALSKDPAERFTSAREMEQALAAVPRSSEVEPTLIRSGPRFNSGEFPRPEEFRKSRGEESRRIRPAEERAAPPEPASAPPTASRKHLLVAALVVLLFAAFGLWWTRPWSLIDVPNLVGLPQSEAETQLKRLGLTAEISTTQGPEAPGTVTAQEPAPYTRLRRGSQVKLMVVAGPNLVGLPDLRGLTLERARSELKSLQLNLKVRQVEDSEVPEGVVKDQKPEPGAQVALDTSVELVVSSGLKSANLPDLIGMTEDEARAEVTKLKMELLITGYRMDATAPAESVLEQTPSAGVRARPGGKVRVVLSRGRQGLNVPQLEGKTVQEARKLVAEMGLKLVVEGEARPDDAISFQDPPAGDPVTTAEVHVRTTPTTVVPVVQGLPQGEAVARIEGAGLKVGKIVPVPAESAGYVVSQEPMPGIETPPGTAVDLYVGDPTLNPQPSSTPTEEPEGEPLLTPIPAP